MSNSKDKTSNETKSQQDNQDQLPAIPKNKHKQLATYMSLDPRHQYLIHLVVTTQPPQPQYKLYQLVYPNTKDETAMASATRLLRSAKASIALREYQEYHWTTQIATMQEVQAMRSDIARESESEANRLVAMRDLSRTAGYDAVQADIGTQINIINMPGFDQSTTDDNHIDI